MSRAVSISSWRFPCWDARHGAQLHETRRPRRNCDRDCALAAAELHVSAESPRRNILQIQLALPAERRRLAGLAAADPARCWDRLLFCAKESVYKAWFPLARRWLGFEEADITIDPAAATFTAMLLVPGPAVGGSTVGAFRGNFAVGNGLIVTAVSVPAPEPRP